MFSKTCLLKMLLLYISILRRGSLFPPGEYYLSRLLHAGSFVISSDLRRSYSVNLRPT
jgi:hypothetical protein